MKFRWIGRSPQVTVHKVPPKAWHAVSIVAKPTACNAAKALRGCRFLSSDAPRLPLVECSGAHHCLCTYKHHADRRGAQRRDDERAGLRRPKVEQPERREARGRRKSDI